MKREKYDHTLPATRCTEMMRHEVAQVAEVADCDMADVIRDALRLALPTMQLSLGIITLDDLEDDEVEALGLERREVPPVPPAREDRSRGLFGGPPAVG